MNGETLVVKCGDGFVVGWQCSVGADHVKRYTCSLCWVLQLIDYNPSKLYAYCISRLHLTRVQCV